MKLYLVTRQDEIDYDEFDSFVCIAKNPDEARRTNPRSGMWWQDGKWMWNTRNGDEECESHSWVPAGQVDKLSVTLLGNANRRMRVGLVLASFNAG